VVAEPTPWHGLFGLFNDSLPDGWGMLLMDRQLRLMGMDPHHCTPLDRLTYMGKHTMGALTYAPATPWDVTSDAFDLTRMAASAIEVYEGRSNAMLPRLARAGGSPAGARPKVLLHLQGEQMISGESEPPEGFEPWMVKFFSSNEHPDSGRIEYAYSLMAQHAGIVMPETRLFVGDDGNAWFGIRRFDWKNGRRIHMHTLGGLVNADFRLPSLDYIDVLKVTQALTRSAADVARAFRLMVFNVLAHNRDDHSKNFSFLMNEQGEWSLSPAYDLTCSLGIAGEHSTSVAGEGRNPAKTDMLKVGEALGLKDELMDHIIACVDESIAQWQHWCDLAKISNPSTLFPPELSHFDHKS